MFALFIAVFALVNGSNGFCLSQETSPASQGQVASVPTRDVTSTLEGFIDSNTLQRDGKSPFHLLMSFQVFDLKGKPSEQGKLEYWWAGPEGFHLDINAPSIGTIHDVRLDQVPDVSARRSLYLVNELLDAMRFPASILGALKGPLVTEKRDFGKSALECVSALSPALKPTLTSQMAVCTDGTSGTVRLITGQNFAVVRNRVGIFQGTHVALDLAIVWSGKNAITGHVEKLEGFSPGTTAVALTKPLNDPAKSAAKPHASLSAGVIAGNKIGGEQPKYPEMARHERIQGSVVLMANISAAGKIVDLVPVASPDDSLSYAAMEAVKTWTYHPYLLNGSPTEVSTTITVNFNLSSGFGSR